MQAGRMKYKITLLEPRTVTTASGNEKTTYEAVRTVWAITARNLTYATRTLCRKTGGCSSWAATFTR